jgi:hypothetical protein
MSAILHVWDLASPETEYACRAEPQQPAVCIVMVSSLPGDVARLKRSKRRICGNCRRIVAARARRGEEGR